MGIKSNFDPFFPVVILLQGLYCFLLWGLVGNSESHFDTLFWDSRIDHLCHTRELADYMIFGKII